MNCHSKDRVGKRHVKTKSNGVAGPRSPLDDDDDDVLYI